MKALWLSPKADTCLLIVANQSYFLLRLKFSFIQANCFI